MPNERDVLHVLNSHYAYQFADILQSPEHNSQFDFTPQLFTRHVRFRPAIRRSNSLISPRAIVDDGPNHIKIAVIATPNHELLTSPFHSENFVSSGTSVQLSKSIR